MSLISILKRSIRTAAAGLVLVGLLSPANATDRHDAVAVFPDLSISATADHASTALTSHLPWLAPVGHRQPRADQVPSEKNLGNPNDPVNKEDAALDKRIKSICKGC